MSKLLLRSLVLASGALIFIPACSNKSFDPDVEVALDSEELVHGANAERGELLFFDEFPDTRGNGRACETCHAADDSFQLTPKRVEARWQALQARKQQHPEADDPLFRAVDADDQDQDFTLLREHALVRVVIDLPTDDHGRKLVWPVDDPSATSVELFRATPTIENVAINAPYQYDGRFATLQQQALGALRAHAEVECDPEPGALDDIAAFERMQFSSPRVAALADALDRGLPPPNTDPPLSGFEQHGKEIFDRACAVCHGGPRLNEPRPELLTIAGLRDIALSKPVPPFAAALPLAPSPVQNKVREWAVRVPGQEKPEVRPSTDPGMILQTGLIANFNEFDIPSLFGIAKTAPYFRDNSAETLRDVVRHYQLLADGLRTIIPPEVPFPQRPDAIAESDFAPLIAYLRKL